MARLLFNTSLILAIASLSQAAAVPRALTCNNNPVVKVLSLLKASSFCSSYIQLATQTVSVTTTHGTTIVVPATSTAVVDDPLTSTGSAEVTYTTVDYAGVPGETITISVTQTTTPPPVTSLVTTPTTVTTIQTTTFFPDGPTKRELELEDRAIKLPPQLTAFAESVVSSACSCYVPKPTTTKTVTSLPTSLSTSIAVVSSTQSHFVASTIVSQYTTLTFDSTTTSPDSTATATAVVTAPAVTDVSTVTSIETATATTTIVDSTPSFVAYAGPNQSGNFIGADQDGIVVADFQLDQSLSFNSAYQFCVAECVAYGSTDCKSFEILLQPGYWWSCDIFNMAIGPNENGYPLHVVDWQNIGATDFAAYNVVSL